MVQVRQLPCLAKHRNDHKAVSPNWALTKRAATTESAPPVPVVHYSNLTVGIPRETFPDECRVAITPQNIAVLLKKGFSRVLVERGAGEGAQLLDRVYEQAGATIVDRDAVWLQSDIIMKVRSPQMDSPNEIQAMRQGSTVISFMYPAQNKKLVEALAARGVTSFAMDMIPRISRAQTFDALRWVVLAYGEYR